ncbi:nucleotide sugar dehydrogenase [Ruania halotolerans]|uniref:nucleotide sugar dehydrogenase n=1 Tax=Ruania halotolerans TaxID=2897773 RepID=UPI001E532E66|nr:nucleotide sugar dehydrogenase [Ruania halotolerans]UFU07565.1 nucleotide sugar dehydrogenase [Ruania halotolerans]
MSADVVVLGLGYVGLPLAQEAARQGLRVVGLDISAPVVEQLNAGRSHIDDLSDADIAEMLAAGFQATTDESVIDDSTAVVVCVPTPLAQDGAPDLGAVTGAVSTIARHVHPGLLVVLESTTWPGTTEEIVQPVLEGGGLEVGVDIHLAFSPERIDPGNAVYGIKNTPKVVGGVTPACTEKAAAFYSRFIDTVVPAKGTREAETSKLLENTFRHINIALVNEMARFCHELGIDLWNVIDLAKTKPFGFQAFYPGPGVGGHCIPIDPNYLSYTVRTRLGYPFRFVELAQEVNSGMPAYVTRRAQDLLNEDAKALRGANVLLLGVTYKPNIADQRESPAVPLAEHLLTGGANVTFHDPNVTTWHLGHDPATSRSLERVPDLDEAVRSADLVILVQNHSSYDLDSLTSAAHRFFDTRGVTTQPEVHRL